jgi:hypothetical protein
MVPKCELPESIPLHYQRLNFGVGICELEDHVGQKGLNSNWSTKLGLAKKTPPTSFPICMLEST